MAGLVLIACAAPVANAQSVIVGRVESMKMVGTLQDVLGSKTSDDLWHGELYELDVSVLKVLSGEDPGETVPVKISGHALDIEGLMITLVIDPALKFHVPGQSWWAPTHFPGPACVPKELVEGPAYRPFVAKSFERGGERCVTL